MAYRNKPMRNRLVGADLVTVRTYLDVIEAELGRACLESADIPAVVLEPTAFNPMLTGAAGGVQLRVCDVDLERAEDVLAAATVANVDEDDGEGDEVVRCPRCELAYCSYGRPPLQGSAVNVLVLLAWLVGFAQKKRWHCAKCEYVWDDQGAGPRVLTPLAPGDPRPVFRLRRNRRVMGMFIGLLIAAFAAVIAAQLLPPDLAPAIALFPIAGWLLGRRVRTDVCSEPACRAPLAPGAETCSRCKGTIAGAIDSAAEHYAAAADVRRELAQLVTRPSAST